MGSSELQNRAAAFARGHGIGLDPAARFLDMSAELGELAKALLKSSGYGERPITASPETEEELGDCLFSLLLLAEALGLDAERALQLDLEKYERRFAQTGQTGSGR